MNLNFLNGINLSNILNGFNKSLNIVKKSIPIYKNIRPYVNKEKSLFKNDSNNTNILNKPSNSKKYNDSLTFFH